MAVYGGVTGLSKEVSKVYVGVNNAAVPVTAIYAGVNGVAKEVYSMGDKLEDYMMFVQDGLSVESDKYVGHHTRIYMSNDDEFLETFNSPVRFSNNGVTSIALALESCGQFNQPITIPNTVTNMCFTFDDCYNFNQPVTIPPNVTNMKQTFANTLFNYPVEFPSTLIDANATFSGCSQFNQELNLKEGVTNMRNIVAECPLFNSPVTIPDTVTDCYRSFMNCYNFNQPVVIGNNVTNCMDMFLYCTNLNQNIVLPPNAVDCSEMFGGCTNFLVHEFYIPSTVTQMRYMFLGCNFAPVDSVAATIYVNATSGVNTFAMVRGKPTSQRLYIYCNNIAMFRGNAAANSITNTAITWSTTTNGIYNAAQNIYIYSNYSEEGGKL